MADLTLPRLWGLAKGDLEIVRLSFFADDPPEVVARARTRLGVVG